MSDDTGKPPPDFKGSLNIFFTKTVNIIDENLRIVQNTFYGIAFVGVCLSLKSLKVFSKFRRIEDIPVDFITKQVKLRGRVISVHSGKYIGLPVAQWNKRIDSSTTNYSNSSESKTSSTIEENETFPNLKDNSSILQNEPSSRAFMPIYVNVSHTPIINLRRRDKTTDGLLIKLASLQVTAEGMAKAQRDLVGKNVWFKILKCEADQTCLLCILRPTANYFLNYNNSLVREGLAFADLFDEDMKSNKLYVNYYAKLLKDQERLEKRSYRLWKKLQSWFR